MEDMIREENLLKVKDYIKHLDIKNYDSIANFDFLLDWIDINSIKLNYEEIIALINTDDYFKKMIFDVCSLDKINYDKLNLNEATFVKNMVRAYKIVQEVNSKEINDIEKELENFSLDDIRDEDVSISTMELDPLNFYLSQAPKRLLTREEVIDLCKKRDLGSQRAREILAEYNLKLVVSIAVKHRRAIEHCDMIQGVDLMDLVSSGNEGLMIAIDKYNYKLGWSFSTYASWWIMWAIRRTLTNESRTIRVSAGVHEDCLTINKAISRYYEQYHKTPSDEELAKFTNMPLNKVKTALQQLNNVTFSLNAPIENIDDCETEFGDFIEDKENSKESIEKKILNDEFREALINARLTDKEKFVILNRFGFIDGENHTLEEIGQMVGGTRERVRQIENKCIRKLRKDPKIKKIA